MDLFDKNLRSHKAAPLADRIRPETLSELVGQKHLIGPDKFLKQAIEEDTIPSLILWGPPGTGKTTLAMVIARHTGSVFQSYSAVTSGIKELKVVLAEARSILKFQNQKTILFIDEIHRFNKAQQDAFLPFVEQGIVTLIGATTENPSFEVNAALLSRCQVLVLKSIALEDLVSLLKHALQSKEKGLGSFGVQAEKDALALIAEKAHGDARAALNSLEITVHFIVQKKGGQVVTSSDVEEAIQVKALQYDKNGEEYYNIISALHKSIRGSDPDAALYWLGRMLEAGESPRYVLRRLARMASEDIGLADPNALLMATSAQQAFEFVGLPEGKLFLAQLAIYLSLAPKSNAIEMGYMDVQNTIRKNGALPVPMHIRNAPTKLMKELGYGKDYRYAHDYDGHWVPDDYLPDKLIDKRFFHPTTSGWEGRKKEIIDKRLEKRKEYRKKKNKKNGEV